MTKNEIKFVKNWESKRKNGRLMFTLKYGGIWVAFLSITMTIFQHYSFDFELNFFSYAINFAANFITGFILYYYIFWTTNEAKFEKFIAKHSGSSLNL